MKYKIDTYEDFLKLKPAEVNSIFENFEDYTDDEMRNLMNFVAMFEAKLPAENTEFEIAAESVGKNIFEECTNKEILNNFKKKK